MLKCKGAVIKYGIEESRWDFLYYPIKYYNAYYGLHLQELLFNTTRTSAPVEQKAVSTPRKRITDDKEK